MKRDVGFPFGHGLSYTEFAIDHLDVAVSEYYDQLVITVTVENIGNRSGAHTVQVYVSQRQPSIRRPVKELKGFSKVYLDPGERKAVEIILSLKYAASFWDEHKNAWIMEKDIFHVSVGSSLADKNMLGGSFEVSKTTWWRGL